MTPLGYAVMALVLVHFWIALAKDYSKGILVAVFYLVWLPHPLRLEISGPLPELTIHRIILFFLLGAGIRQARLGDLRGRVPLFGFFVAGFIVQTISMILSMDPGLSFKRLFGTVFEDYLLFILIVASVGRKAEAIGILKAAALGLAIGGLLTPLDYYKGINLTAYVVSSAPMLDRGGSAGSYMHRIHLGYAMAMGFPLLLAFLREATRAIDKVRSMAYIASVSSACYFGMSRGPWMGAILAGGVLFGAGTRRLKTMLMVLGIIPLVLMAALPGVRETVVGMLDSVFVHNGEQEASAEYRKILWKVADAKIGVSSTRFLFGCGGLTTELMDISEFFERGRGGNVMASGYSSWDSQWAANLVQFGWIGFLLEILMRLKLLQLQLQGWKKASDLHIKELLLAIIASNAVYTWAMLTVSMFSPQLKYLFWATAAASLILASDAEAAET